VKRRRTIGFAANVDDLDAKVEALPGDAPLQRLKQAGAEHRPDLVRAAVALVQAKLPQLGASVAQHPYPRVTRTQ